MHFVSVKIVAAAAEAPTSGRAWSNCSQLIFSDANHELEWPQQAQSATFALPHPSQNR
jgi:hypothetical protein